MKTIAQQLNVTDFPFEIKDKNGNQTYYEDSNGFWARYERDSNGKTIYYENSGGYWWNTNHDSNGKHIYFGDSYGKIIDNSAKEIITVNGIKYQRIEP